MLPVVRFPFCSYLDLTLYHCASLSFVCSFHHSGFTRELSNNSAIILTILLVLNLFLPLFVTSPLFQLHDISLSVALLCCSLRDPLTTFPVPFWLSIHLHSNARPYLTLMSICVHYACLPLTVPSDYLPLRLLCVFALLCLSSVLV